MILTEEHLLLAGAARLVGRQPLFAYRGGVARQYARGALSVLHSKCPDEPETIRVQCERRAAATFVVRDTETVVCEYLNRDLLPTLTRTVTRLGADD